MPAFQHARLVFIAGLIAWPLCFYLLVRYSAIPLATVVFWMARVWLFAGAIFYLVYFVLNRWRHLRRPSRLEATPDGLETGGSSFWYRRMDRIASAVSSFAIGSIAGALAFHLAMTLLVPG